LKDPNKTYYDFSPDRLLGSLNRGVQWADTNYKINAARNVADFEMNKARHMNMFNNAHDTFRSQAGPMDAMLGMQNNRIRGRIAPLNSLYSRKDQNVRRMADLDLAGIGLKERGIGIDRDAITADRSLIDILRGTAREGFDNTRDQINQRHLDRRLDTNSEYLGRGAWFSPRRQSRLQSNDSERDTGIRGADISLRERLANLDRQSADTDFASRRLDILAEEFGLDRQRINEQMSMALHQLGYDRWMGVDQLMEAIDSNDFRRQELAFNVFKQAADFMALMGDPAMMQMYGAGVAGQKAG